MVRRATGRRNTAATSRARPGTLAAAMAVEPTTTPTPGPPRARAAEATSRPRCRRRSSGWSAVRACVADSAPSASSARSWSACSRLGRLRLRRCAARRRPTSTVAGVDVGGLDRRRRRSRSRASSRSRLAAPVQVTIGERAGRGHPDGARRSGSTWTHGRRRDEGGPRDVARCCRSSATPPRCRSCSCRPAEPQADAGRPPLEQKAINAKLAVSADGKVSATPSRQGLDVRPRAAGRGRRRGRARRQERGRAIEPRIIDAEGADHRSREGRGGGSPAALAGPITLRSGGKNVGKVTPKELAPAIVIGECDADACKVRIDADKLAKRHRRRREEARARAGRRQAGACPARRRAWCRRRTAWRCTPSTPRASCATPACAASDGRAGGGRPARRPSPR